MLNEINNILHITNWYPNRSTPHGALFIKEHFDACERYVNQQLWHIQVRNDGAFFRFRTGDYSTNEHYLILDTRIQAWRLQELLTLFLLVLVRAKLGRRSWDLVNVHIAYPLLRFPRVFKFLYGKRIIIAEHWSAYRSNFHLPDTSKAKRRIQGMFNQGIPVIAVSQALMNDIVKFSSNERFPQYIVPNIVNPTLFYPNHLARSSKGSILLMAGFWAPIKLPFLAMEAFNRVLTKFPDIKLRIIGGGQQCPDMQSFIAQRGLEERIALLGSMSKLSVANEMRQADFFLHASQYETFSVVCAEALCCGLPVIASNVGGIPEVVGESSGILVENTPDAWVDALQSLLSHNDIWDRDWISRKAISRFNQDVVGSEIARVFRHSILNK